MVTISDIAAKAGVSRTTVSYVLNDNATSIRISAITRQRVLSAVAELGYRRNELARAVTTGKSRMLGFWVMQSRAEPVARVLSGAMKEADEHGYFFKMIGFDNLAPDRQIIDRCIEWRLSGVIAIHAPNGMLVNLLPPIREAGLPLAIVDSQCPPNGVPHFASNQTQGMRLAVEHLVKLGHRRIACIAGRPDDDDCISRERVAAYRGAMQAHGLRAHASVEYGHWFIESSEGSQKLGEQAARKLLSSQPRPTGIVCVSDHAAMIAIRTAWEMGFQVPRDLSVTGFDDLAMAALCHPPLTTVAQSFETLGQLAVRCLLAQLEAEEEPSTAPKHFIETQLVVRASTAAPPRTASK